MIVLRMQKTFPLRATEWMLAGITVTLGVVLLANLALFDTSASLKILTRILPHTLAAGLILIVGVVRTMALIINGAWRASPHLRAFCAFLSTFVWLQIVFSLFTGHVVVLGMAVYPWFLIMDIGNVFRAAADARIADDRAKGLPVGS